MNRLIFNTSDGYFYLNGRNVGDYIEATIVEPMVEEVVSIVGGRSKSYRARLLLTLWCDISIPVEVDLVLHTRRVAWAFDNARTGDEVTLVPTVAQHGTLHYRTLVVR